MRLDATHALSLLCFELLHVLVAADEGNFSVAPQGEATAISKNVRASGPVDVPVPGLLGGAYYLHF